MFVNFCSCRKCHQKEASEVHVKFLGKYLFSFCKSKSSMQKFIGNRVLKEIDNIPFNNKRTCKHIWTVVTKLKMSSLIWLLSGGMWPFLLTYLSWHYNAAFVLKSCTKHLYATNLGLGWVYLTQSFLLSWVLVFHACAFRDNVYQMPS